MAKKKTAAQTATAEKKPAAKKTAKTKPAAKQAPAATKSIAKKTALAASPAPAATLTYPESHHGLLVECSLEEQAADHHRVVMVNAVVTQDGGCGSVTISGWDCFGNPTATAFASVQFDSKSGTHLPSNTATLIIPPHGKYTIVTKTCAPGVEFRMNQYEVT